MAVAADALVQYLSSLPPVNLDRLYADSWVCHALLRALPPLARLYVVRLAAAHGSLPKALVDSWPARVREAAKRPEESMQQLHLLRLVHRVPAAGCGQEQLRLHEAFGAAMLDSLGQGPPGSPRGCEPAPQAPGRGTSAGRWEDPGGRGGIR